MHARRDDGQGAWAASPLRRSAGRGAWRSLLLAGTCLAATPALAQTFVPQGPAPGNGAGITDANSFQTFTGSTSALVVNPVTGALVLGSVNGGIWTAPNAGAANGTGTVTWTPRADDQAGLSIATLAYDPADPTRMIAGIGAISNGGAATGPLTGVMTSTTSGSSWTTSTIAGLPADFSVTASAIGGNVLLVGSSDLVDGYATSAVGLYRSVNGGNFTNIAGNLPGQVASSPVTAIVRGSDNSTLFIAAGGGSSGEAPSIYKGTIDGSTWTSVVGAGSALATELSTQSQYVKEATPTDRYDTAIRLATGPDNTLVAAVLRQSLVGDATKSYLQSVYYSPDNGTTWYKVPLTNADGSALTVTGSGQGLTNFSIAVDPKNKNAIYIAGDTSQTTTRVGAYYLPIYKLTLDAKYSNATVTDLGVLTTSNNANTFIHPDVRGISFDANGQLVVLTDGGIYQVSSSTGTWRGINNNLQLGEYYQVGYDSRNKLIGAAAQDNGVQLQTAPGSTTLSLIKGGDGINISFADKNGQTNTTVYASNQSLGLSRFTYDSATKTLGARTDIALFDGTTQINGGGSDTESDDDQSDAEAPFSAKFVLNKFDQKNFVVGTTNVYVGTDSPGTQGTSDGQGAFNYRINLTNVGATTGTVTALAYGVTGNQSAVLAGADNKTLWLSTTGAANSLTQLTAYNTDSSNNPTGAGTPLSVVFDARTIQHFYSADGFTVWGTTDEGNTFTNLRSQFPTDFNMPRALEFISQNGVNALVIGGLNDTAGLGNQIVVAGSKSDGTLYNPNNPTGASTFIRFGAGMPNAPVFSLYYSPDADVLVAGTFGRGAYVLYDVTSFFPQATTLWFGKADNDSTPVLDQLKDGKDENGTAFARGLTKFGAGTLTIASGLTAQYTGATTIENGMMVVDGSITSSSGVTVSGGTLAGTGTVPTITEVESGGTLRPGNTANPTGTLTVTGNLTFAAGANYAVQFSGANAALTSVSGTANLAGTLQTIGVGGTYLLKTPYTVLTAGTLNGAFTTTSSGVGATLARVSYNSNNVFVTLDPNMVGTVQQTTSSPNDQRVAAVLDGIVNAGGTLPAKFQNIYAQSGAALTEELDQISGEGGTEGGVQSGVQLTNSFLALVLNPFGGGTNGNPGTVGPTRAFAAADNSLSPAAAAAYAAVTPRDRRAGFERRWSVWGQAYGGWNKTAGDASAGTQDTTARTFGLATGFDYRVAADTMLGFALAGAGTSWSVGAGLGSGRSDALQIGLYGSHSFGAAYVSGALSYAWHRMTTDRTVTAGPDQLRANFNAQSFGGRIETGYRLATPFVDVTPYAAAQLQVFRTPAYAETTVSGTGTFALSYDAHSTTATRTELGAWFDKPLALDGGHTLVLRSRAAWAHDHSTDQSVTAAFQSLAGSSFTVNGAATVPDLALLSSGAELRLAGGFSIGARFDGEFASRSQTYAGTATVRYEW